MYYQGIVYNPPACRRVLWIVLVSSVGFNLRFVSPRGFFDSLMPPTPTPPSPPLSTSKVIGLRHVDRWIRIDTSSLEEESFSRSCFVDSLGSHCLCWFQLVPLR